MSPITIVKLALLFIALILRFFKPRKPRGLP
jgi:hypothetical protein